MPKDKLDTELARLERMARWLEGKGRELDWPPQELPITIVDHSGATRYPCERCGRPHCICEEMEEI